MSHRFFFNRRAKTERRMTKEQRHNPRLDLSHKRRRKSDERRQTDRDTTEDFYASNNFFRRRNLGNQPPQTLSLSGTLPHRTI